MSTRNELVKSLSDNSNSTSPALNTGAAVTTVVGALYLILQYAFPKIPDDIINAGLAVVAIAIPFITSWVIRSKVWAPASVAAVVDESVKTALETAQVLKSPHLMQIPRPMTLEESDSVKKKFLENYPTSSSKPLFNDVEQSPEKPTSPEDCK